MPFLSSSSLSSSLTSSFGSSSLISNTSTSIFEAFLFSSLILSASTSSCGSILASAKLGSSFLLETLRGWGSSSKRFSSSAKEILVSAANCFNLTSLITSSLIFLISFKLDKTYASLSSFFALIGVTFGSNSSKAFTFSSFSSGKESSSLSSILSSSLTKYFAFSTLQYH